MTFAQALARIEEHLNHGEYTDAGILLDKHADSIVQLGKVSKEMRAILHLMDDPRDWKPVAKEFDSLMKGE